MAESTTSPDVESSGDYVEASSTAPTRKSMTFLRLCDFRIATIFVNGLNIAMILVSVLVAAIRAPLFFKSVVGTLALGLPGLVLSGLGLYGAHKFELWAMYLATAGFLVAVILDGIMMNWLGFAVTLIVLIPHVILTYEMRSGIITKETYDTEEFLIPQGREFVDKAHSYMAPTSPAVTE
jgi:Na+-transporting methylmalonyl-CoA/oxaloacetate decarboxylase gamma subunit